MPTYEALIQIPWSTSGDELVEALREYAYPRLLVTIEAKSKRAAAHLLAESSGPYVRQYNHTEDWWFDQLKVVRHKRDSQ
jgi:hypothetical protein